MYHYYLHERCDLGFYKDLIFFMYVAHTHTCQATAQLFATFKQLWWFHILFQEKIDGILQNKGDRVPWNKDEHYEYILFFPLRVIKTN